MTVQELVEFLSRFPGDMPVKYSTGMFGGDIETKHIAMFVNKDNVFVNIDLDS